MREHRVRDPADDRDEPGDPGSAQSDREQSSGPAYERTGKHVARIVKPERDSGEADQSRSREKEDAGTAGERENPERDGEGDRSVVTRKGGIGEGAERRCVNAGCVTNGRGRSHRCEMAWFVIIATAAAVRPDAQASFHFGSP